jgi:hypothetical protein
VSAINNLVEASGGSPKGIDEFDGKKGTPVEILDSGSRIDDEDYAYKIVNGKKHEVTFSKAGEIKFLKVRLLKGKEKGKIGWVPKEYVSAKLNVFEIEKSTARARRISVTELMDLYKGDIPDKLLSGDFFILRMHDTIQEAITKADTIEKINDPNKCEKLVGYAVRKLQADVGTYDKDYYINFSKEMFYTAIAFDEKKPKNGVNLAGDTFGRKVHQVPDVLPAYHIYEALVAKTPSTGYDKVQHFCRSAREQYNNGKVITDLLQYAKETIELDFDMEDMKANNLGQEFGKDLYDKYNK